MNKLKKLFNPNSLPKYFVLLAAIFAIWYWRTPLGDLLSMISDRERIATAIHQYGSWGPIILTLILGLQVFLAVIPGHAFIIAGGYVYGLFFGALITQISTVAASQIAFLLTRKHGRPFVNRMAPAHVIDHWNKLAEKQGCIFFFFSFILPIFPNDLMSFIAGLTSISPKKFFAANFFGRLPCAIFITLIGSHGVEMPIGFWVVVVILIIGLCISWKKISKKLDRIFIKKHQPVCV